MVKEFKAKIKENGQSLSWFYNHFKVKEKVGITYGGFCHQLNGYAPLAAESKKLISEYLGKNYGGAEETRA